MGSAANVLLVGVGGTGTKIVKNMLEGWERDGGLPRHVTAAIIDAHDGQPEGGTRRDWVYSGSRRIDFQRDWQLHYNRSDSGLSAWWPSRVQQNSRVGFHDGCGATRANGRFFSFHFADRIKETIVAAMDRLSSARFLGDAAPNQPVNWEAYICLSLGNGTGAGNMLPIAAMVRHLLLERGAIAPRVSAVVVPGSVTKAGQGGMLAAHVAASGVAALLELQYEANRKSGSLDRPSEPYVHIGYVGGNYAEFRPFSGLSDTSEAATSALLYDNVFVLDQYNSSGVRHEYGEILTVGAESLRALLTGADQDGRIMDLEVRAGTEGRNFGSLGVMAYAAPTAQLATWCAAKQVMNVLKEGSRSKFQLDLEGDKDLLMERGGEAPLDISKARSAEEAVSASVLYFCDHVLQAREEGSNDLFERFQPAHDKLTAEFHALSKAAADESNVKERAGKYRNMLGAMDAMRTEVAKFDAMLGREYAALPDEGITRYAQGTDQAGAQWILEARALSFLEAGKPGLGATWFAALQGCLTEQRQSVHDTELKVELGGRLEGADTKGLTDLLDQLERDSKWFFSFLKTNSITATGEEFEAGASKAFKTITWQAKVKAVLAHYDRLVGHTALMEKALSSAARALANKELLAPAQKLIDEVDQSLQTKGGGAKLKFLGVNPEVRDAMLGALNGSGSATSVATIAATATAEWIDLAASCLNELDYGQTKLLDKRRAKAGWPSGGGQLWAARVVDRLFAGAASGAAQPVRLEETIRAHVRRTGNIEGLLLSEGTQLLTKYYNLCYKDGGLTTPEAVDVRTAVGVVLGDLEREVEGEFSMIGKGRSFEAAMLRPSLLGEDSEGALMVYLRARMLGMMGAARPLWRPNAGREELAIVQRMAFFTFAAGAKLLRQAAGALGSGVKIQAVTDYPPDRVECVSVELGGKAEWLLTDGDIESYRQAVHGMPGDAPLEPRYIIYQGFNPHSERKYQDFGQRWLEKRDERAQGASGSGGGEVLLGLARVNVPGKVLLGYLEQRGPNFHLARAIEQVYGTTGDPILDPMTILPEGAHVGPAGIVDFVEWLEGKSRGRREGTEGEAFATTFKEILWRDLKTWLQGDAEKDIAPVPLDEVCKWINDEAGRCRTVRGDDTRSVRTRSVGEALSTLADALRKSRGARPIALTP